MSYQVRFFKDRQKFSAAHFTLFADGDLERLHGHNYHVSVTVAGDALEKGLLFPFHEAKAVIKVLCDAWDEYVLLPTASDWVTVEERGDQYEVRVHTPIHQKFYSFPKEDCRLLDCDNISCENLCRIFGAMIGEGFDHANLKVNRLTVTIAESSGQEVSVEVRP